MTRYMIDPRLVRGLRTAYCERCTSQGMPRTMECLRCVAAFDMIGGTDMTHDGKAPTEYVEVAQ